MKKRIIASVLALILTFLLGGCNDSVEDTETTPKDILATGAGIETEVTEDNPIIQEEVVPEVPTNLPEYYVDDLLYDMANNALRAELKYQDQYILLTGTIASFDSDGRYFALEEIDEDYGEWSTVLCVLTSEEQVFTIVDYNVGDIITIKCLVTDIGEIQGYTVDVLEFICESGSDHDVVGEEQDDWAEHIWVAEDEHIFYLQGGFIAVLDAETQIHTRITAYWEDYGEITYYLDYCTDEVELYGIPYYHDECYGNRHSILFDIGPYYPEYDGVVEVTYSSEFGCSIASTLENCIDTYGDYYELIPTP